MVYSEVTIILYSFYSLLILNLIFNVLNKTDMKIIIFNFFCLLLCYIGIMDAFGNVCQMPSYNIFLFKNGIFRLVYLGLNVCPNFEDKIILNALKSRKALSH